MFTTNPFAELAGFISPGIMKWFVIIMILFVIGGTIFDVLHKKSAKYFFDASRKAAERGSATVDGGQKMGIAVQTALVDVATSAEFCNPKRRIAHLLGMYGFILYIIATMVMVFAYGSPDAETPAFWPLLWWLGGLMICVGGYWFWFFIRVDVASEGNSRFRLVRADLFILSLLAMATFGIVWAILQYANSFSAVYLLGLYLIATVVLFAGVPWSKFSHMFFKPAAAFQKRVEIANGSRRNLPAPADKPAQFGKPVRVPQNY